MENPKYRNARGAIRRAILEGPAGVGASRVMATAMALALTLFLAACNGPWNMQPETGAQPAKLWVSLLLVADRPLDTLWLERPYALTGKKDSSLAFVDPAATDIRVVETGTGAQLRYLPVAGRAAAWVPEDAAYRVKKGAAYALSATVRWNAAADFPAGAEWKTEKLSATAQVPAAYALDSALEAPLEALHPSLSTGLPAASAARARGDAAYRKALFDSLNGLPGVKPLTEHGVTESDFAAYLDAKAVFRPLRRGDTLFYIFDAAMATDYSGVPTHRYSLPWIIRQHIDKRDFGGVILSQHFDSARARIYDPLQKGLDDAFQKDLDSAAFYQRGNVRPMIIAGSYFSDLKGYPDTLRLTNLLWGYTGRNVLYAYSVDPLYFEYYKGMIQTGSDQTSGHGGGNSRPQNVLRYSNVENGDGFFTGAAVDSFDVNLRAVRDTIPVSSLRDAWMREHTP